MIQKRYHNFYFFNFIKNKILFLVEKQNFVFFEAKRLRIGARPELYFFFISIIKLYTTHYRVNFKKLFIINFTI